ncbi:MAG: hypothetical protein HKN85_03640 [Gammaproteobacteria bacterium]|nr:hypothetical protein [Gammaproteobacteria bacterium]
MCTMTWFVKAGGYELFFNRDERVSRRHAELPTVQQADGVTYISPTDTDAGGTWIAVNHFGITVCLLNHYQFEQIVTYKKWISRGEIVRQLAVVKTLAAAEQQFSKLELNDYRAFRMFTIDQFGNNRLCVWDGHTPRVEENVSTPKSSSAVDAMHVKTVRKQLFSQLGLATSQNSDDFIRYHSGHIPERSKESVCMHREDANTVSLSHVDVAGSRIHFAYADGAPCQASLVPAQQINLLSDTEVQTVADTITLAAIN